MATSTQPKGARLRRRINREMVENVLLIWLDDRIDENNSDYHNSITQLRRIVNTTKTFTNNEECVKFLESIEDEKACMLISDALGPHTVRRIHDMSQVDSIFILCDNIQVDQEWSKDWTKIKGIFTEIAPICDALVVVAHQCEQNVTSISFMSTSDDISKKDLNQLDPTFMYTQILKEVLLSIKFEEQHIMEFLAYCRKMFENNEKALKTVKELEKYKDETPIWWYTDESFLYPMLNRALRVLDGDIIIKLGFFISDLHRDIDKLFKEQFNDENPNKTLTLYRGQGMNQDDFNQMKQAKGGLLAFNCFLSTSRNQKLSLRFAKDTLKYPDSMGILFVVNIDSRQSATPFASVADVGAFGDAEEEILFSMHTVFRIGEITPMEENSRLYQVYLTLTNDNDKDLSALTNRIREETEGLTGWDQLGELLLKIGQSEKAKQVYEVLLEQSTIEIEKARFYNKLGLAKDNLGEYQEALTLYEKGLEIRKQFFPLNYPDLASSYHNIGNVYRRMGEYEKSLSSHEKALEMRKESLTSDHPDLARSYNSIGNVYRSMGEYEKALSYYEKALEMRKQILPANHPDLANSYDNIGIVYQNMGEYEKAPWYYEKALEIRKQSLPSNHPALASSYNDIGIAYGKMGEYEKALSSHEKALEIDKKALPPTHPDLALDYNNIGIVYYNMDEYEKALSSYEKALEIQKQSLPSNHPKLASSYNNIGLVYKNMDNYLKARSYYERAIEIGKQSLPENHPDLKMYKNNLDDIKDKV